MAYMLHSLRWYASGGDVSKPNFKVPGGGQQFWNERWSQGIHPIELTMFSVGELSKQRALKTVLRQH